MEMDAAANTANAANTAALALHDASHPLPCRWVVYFAHRALTQRVDPNGDYNHLVHPIASFDSVESFWNVYSHLRRPSSLAVISDYHYFKDGIRPMWEDPMNDGGGKWVLRVRKELTCKLWEELLLDLIGGNLHTSINGIVLSVRPRSDIISIWVAPSASEIRRNLNRRGGDNVHFDNDIDDDDNDDNDDDNDNHDDDDDQNDGAEKNNKGGSDAAAAAAEYNHNDAGLREAIAARMRVRAEIIASLGLGDQVSLEFKEHRDSMRDKSSYRNTDIFR